MNKTERIVDAARKRFRHYGIGKTTMQEIATDAGVAVGTVYLYFKNKDDLVVACAAEFVERHRHAAATILASPLSADAKLRAYVLDRFRQAEETRTGSRHAVEITQAVLRVKPDRALEEGRMIMENVTRILQEGVAARVFRIADPAADAKVFLFSIAYFFPSAVAEPIPHPQEADLLLVVEWFLRCWQGENRTGSRVRKTNSTEKRKRVAREAPSDR